MTTLNGKQKNQFTCCWFCDSKSGTCDLLLTLYWTDFNVFIAALMTVFHLRSWHWGVRVLPSCRVEYEQAAEKAFSRSQNGKPSAAASALAQILNLATAEHRAFWSHSYAFFGNMVAWWRVDIKWLSTSNWEMCLMSTGSSEENKTFFFLELSTTCLRSSTASLTREL